MGAYLIFVDIGVEQFLVAAVDDSGAVAGSKDMIHATALEGLERDGLATQAQLFPLAQLSYNPHHIHHHPSASCVCVHTGMHVHTNCATNTQWYLKLSGEAKGTRKIDKRIRTR